MQKKDHITMRSTIALTVFALAITGCAKTESEEILPPACRNFQQTMEAKKNIEKYLGRKMRTQSECERDFDVETAKMKAVRDGKVGPDLKKLRPAGIGK